MSDDQLDPLPPDSERAKLFPDGAEVHVDVPYIPGISHYILRLCYTFDAGATEEEIVMVDELFVRPHVLSVPVQGHHWRNLDPAKDWRVHVTPVLGSHPLDP